MTLSRVAGTPRVPVAPADRRPGRLSRKFGRRGGAMLRHLATIVLVLFATLPVLWMISTSLKTRQDANATPPQFLPANPTFEGYVTAWNEQNLGQLLINSLIVSLGATLISLVVGGLAGYVLSRFHSPTLAWIAAAMFLSQIIPGVLLVIPFYEYAARLGLVNSYLGLILAYSSFAIPFTVALLKGVFDAIPDELDDAAQVDGCGRIGALFRVVAPLAAPGIAAIALYSFLISWSEFLFGFILMSDPEMMPITVALVAGAGAFDINWNALMATAMITALPPIILYVFLEKYLVSGLSAGAVKG